ncbi:CD209 antigen-like protein C isoform X5 [Pipistrellus kuhlii]|uniref:CD209 antigen-like protein C isoform X5 n=1 Tax=Pipistrellus kuhlii TaxID=59472 RepID=UPI001E270F47|nr:CD209 antigen-like protein C isoform X5 [Pipistrellus kuhlii]
MSPGGVPRTIHEVIKTEVQGGAGQNREAKKMAEMFIPKEPEEREIFQGQRSSERDPWLSRSSRSLPAPSSAHSVTECLTRAPLHLILVLFSLGLFMLMLVTLIQVSRIQQSLPRKMDDQESHSPVAVLQSDLEEIVHQLTRMNATLTGLCRHCPWNWDFFQGSCYFFSKVQSPWKASVSACKDMKAQLVVISNAEEQKFLKSWDIRKNKDAWIGLSDEHSEGSWKWVDNTSLHISFWKEGEPNNVGDEDCVELSGDGWNDSLCNEEQFWICEKPSALCPGL